MGERKMNFMDFAWIIIFGAGIVCMFWHRKKVVKMEVHQHFTLKEMGISVEKWQSFCHLAAYRRTSQSKQLGEAVSYFVEHGGR